MAGVSRSPAAAYIVAVLVRKEDPVRAAVQLCRAAPFAEPNLLMVRYADDLGGWNGAMLAAIRNARGVRTIDRPAPFEI
jgi:predicted protein tyrosine phosphatase